MAQPAMRDLADEMATLCHRGLHVGAFFAEAARIVRRGSPYDGCCWFTLDPATFLPTSHLPENSIRQADVPRLARNEYEEQDVNKFVELARLEATVGILSIATDGQVARSIRYREVLAPNDFEHELRVTFMLGGAAWGGAAFYRRPGEADFTSSQAAVLARLAPLIAEGARRAILISAIATDATPEGPGLILVDADNRLESITPAADRLLASLVIGSAAGHELPNVVHAVLGRARTLAAREGDMEPAGDLARARVRTADGRWLVLHGTMLEGGRAAVIVEPARPPEIAPLIADAYGLTERERDITQLVLQGLSTQEIGSTLHLSPYTVQDHLKAIFEKTGVRSRRELVAEVFFRHYAPQMGRGDNLSASGWFRPPHVAC